MNGLALKPHLFKLYLEISAGKVELFILKLDNAREKNYYEHILKNVCSQNEMELLLMNIFEKCPILENEKFFIRLFQMDDCDDLLNVYSDKNALPFFNSDGCIMGQL